MVKGQKMTKAARALLSQNMKKSWAMRREKQGFHLQACARGAVSIGR